MPSKEFTFTGTWAKWDVPKKVDWVDVVLEGAGSGSTPGGRVTGRINTKRIQSLRVLVGEKGAQSGGPTVGGGGPAGKGRSLPDGWSGGGASVIRSTSTTGAIKAVAGGAGGASGDDGSGGPGGGDVAGSGLRGDLVETDPPPLTGDIPDVASATGGTQIQGGVGGTSSAAAELAGFDASDDVLAVGGAGGGPRWPGTSGGGGGGGGYHPGGGGVAGWAGETPGTGGGGGSSYAVALTQFTNSIGGGSMGNGRVTLTWVTPPPANQPPSAPTDVKIGGGKGKDYAEEMATFSTGDLEIKATLKDSTSPTVRLIVQYAPDESFTGLKTIRSKYVNKGKQATVNLTGLAQNTLWHMRLYAEDKQGLQSTSYTTVKVWTNRAPNAPTLLLPGENDVIDDIDPVIFGWNHTDPDHDTSPHQSAFNLAWRRSGTPLFPAGPWTEVTFETGDETYVGDPETFKASTTYDWRVRTRDEQNLWGPFSEIRSFFVRGSSAPPWLDSPVADIAVDITDGVTFVWRFRDPAEGASQIGADLQYRLVGTDDWTSVFGDSALPGTEASWYLGPEVLRPGRYEWQVRTYSDSSLEPSAWSDSGFFWAVKTPGVTATPVVPTRTVEARLGCGTNEVHVYRRGGDMYVGRIKPVSNLNYNRKRDDISNCTFTVAGAGYDCASLLREIHTWTHEIVIWRDGLRVWEGPVSRIQDGPNGVFIEARDVWNYIYRRIMRQGYNDVYQITGGVQVGMQHVTARARQIALNALAPDDPNVLEYLTTLNFPDDALESRAVPDFSTTAWEEIDSLAATGGLDYTAIGRRLILWDTHRPLGRLPELRTEHFSDPPIISEYGMLLATDFGVTNNNGVFGLATRRDPGTLPAYGLVELLASAYGESEADSSGTTETLTSEAQAALAVTLTDQAERNIAHRYPTPVIVRVPDNSTLNPQTPISFDHLVPGVWVPLRADGLIRSIAQWQKLDLVTVTDDPAGEKIAVTFSPAPNAGEDPDAGVGTAADTAGADA
jgi:hypothetical protein